ncbi:MAG: DUF333 domain-containing protein [bacterium]
MKKNILIAVLIILVCLGLYYIYQKTTDNNDVKEGVINSAIFTCAENKNINALFFKDKAELTLSDGRNMLLMQAISASGARYANTDESFVFWNKGDTAFVTEGDKTTFADCVIKPVDTATTTVGLANPASVNCKTVGGNLVMQKNGNGDEYGLCYFEENRACEEWALFRGDCPVGGRKTTGFDTIDQNYCAWAGGETFAVPNSVCTFKNGSKCSTLDFYNGKCSAK